MKNQPPFPVTPENLPQYWETIDTMRRKARRKSAIAGIGGFWSNLFLLFSLLFVANGLMFEQFHGSYHAFLEMLPWFSDVWHYLTDLVIKAGDSLTIQVVKLLLVTYGAAIAVFALLALLVSLLYHPRKAPVPTGDYSEQTALLAKAAREAHNYSYKTHISAYFSTIIMLIVAVVILFGAYAIYSNDPVSMAAVLTQFPTGNQNANLLFYVTFCYLVCAACCEILLLLTRPLYRCKFPYDYIVQTEYASLYALEEDEEATPEKHIADAAALCGEAVELEKDCAYTRAKSLYFKAALGGDVNAMKHYARLCLIDNMNDTARYWLERCVSSGQESKDIKSMLLRLKLRMKHNVSYLQPEAAPLTKGQKIWNTVKRILSILLWILSLLMAAALVIFLIVLLKSDADITVFTDLSNVLRILFE